MFIEKMNNAEYTTPAGVELNYRYLYLYTSDSSGVMD